MDTIETRPEGTSLTPQPGTSAAKEAPSSLFELLLYAVLIVYLIHVLMGWTYAFFWWPLQS